MASSVEPIDRTAPVASEPAGPGRRLVIDVLADTTASTRVGRGPGLGGAGVGLAGPPGAVPAAGGVPGRGPAAGGAPARGRGTAFGAGLRVSVSAADGRGDAAPTGGRVAATVAEPTLATGAELLADATGRGLAIAEAPPVDRAAAAPASGGGPESACPSDPIRPNPPANASASSTPIIATGTITAAP
jgi:hypothetical protein